MIEAISKKAKQELPFQVGQLLFFIRGGARGRARLWGDRRWPGSLHSPEMHGTAGPACPPVTTSRREGRRALLLAPAQPARRCVLRVPSFRGVGWGWGGLPAARAKGDSTKLTLCSTASPPPPARSS